MTSSPGLRGGLVVLVVAMALGVGLTSLGRLPPVSSSSSSFSSSSLLHLSSSILENVRQSAEASRILQRLGLEAWLKASGTPTPAAPSSASDSTHKAADTPVSLSSSATTASPTCSCGGDVPRLSGVVDDCCCEYETVDAVNVEVLQPLLHQLVQTPFFRYFKVRLWCDCPFWNEDGMCHSRDCSVGECTDEEVPGPLRVPASPPPPPPPPPSPTSPPSPSPFAVDESESALSAVDRTVDRSAFLSWCEDDNPWTYDDESKHDEMTYVNLQLNPERYTGYKGDGARRIWQAIYEESCFRDGPNDTCRERRIFYRLISGFHTSITVHVATSFLLGHDLTLGPPPNLEKAHLDAFKWRVAKFPDRLSNLYFTFLFVLRAAMKASNYLAHATYDTGNPAEDAHTAELVRQLVNNDRLRTACPVPFDEAEMWKGSEGPQLFSTLQQHFRNISAIMDCVGCERCRLWGKLEMLGIATALKILFSEDKEGVVPAQLALQRNEVTALINTLSRFSEALGVTGYMMSLLEQQHQKEQQQQQQQQQHEQQQQVEQ